VTKSIAVEKFLYYTRGANLGQNSNAYLGCDYDTIVTGTAASGIICHLMHVLKTGKAHVFCDIISSHIA